MIKHDGKGTLKQLHDSALNITDYTGKMTAECKHQEKTEQQK